MINTITSEFRKLLTIRSTYITSGIALLLAGFIAFWPKGYKNALFGPDYMQNAILMLVTFTSVFVGIVAILMICHEYRYNTIMYTLTTTNNRLKVIIAKLTVIGAYALVMTVLTYILTLGLITLGASIAGNEIGSQNYDWYSMLWKTLVYVIGSAWLGLAIGLLTRSLVAAFTAYFLIPFMVEPLLISLLKVNPSYLPFSAQNQIVGPAGNGYLPGDAFSAAASAGVFGLYLLGALVIGIILFMRRDAN